MTPLHMDRAETGIRTVIAFTQAFNQHDLAGMLSLVSENCVFDAPDPAPGGAVYKGKDAVRQYWRVFFDRHPNAHLKIESTEGFGLRCIALWRCDWVDPSGAAAYQRGVGLYRVQDGQIVEHFSYVKA
jgi:ketosteroid isomerase-like protein